MLLSKSVKVIGIIVFSMIIFLALSMAILYKVAHKAPTTYKIDSAINMDFEEGNIRYETKKSILGNNSEEHQVLFLHGFNNHIKPNDPAWNAINQCAPAVRLDIPGFGESKWQSNDFTIPKQATRIIKFLDRLKIRKVTIQGGSMGSSLAAWIAAYYPERVNAILIAAPSAYPDSLLYDGIRGFLVKPGPINEFGYMLAKTPIYKTLFPDSKALQSISTASSYGEPWKMALPKIKSPVVLMWSIGDYGVPFKFSGEVNKLIPNSILIPIAREVGHSMKPRAKMLTEITCKLFNNIALEDIAQIYPENEIH